MDVTPPQSLVTELAMPSFRTEDGRTLTVDPEFAQGLRLQNGQPFRERRLKAAGEGVYTGFFLHVADAPDGTWIYREDV